MIQTTIVQVVALEDLQKESAAHKDAAKTVGGYVSPAIDAVAAGKLIQEFGFKTGQVLIKTYKEKQYVIFKGRPGDRKIFKGTRYLVDNPKVVRFAIGPKGIVKSAKAGFAVTFVICTAIEVLSYLFEDETSIAELLGTVSSDFIKIGLSSAAGVIAGMAAGTSVVLGSAAAAPLLIAVAVGIATGIILNKIDERVGATQALIQCYKKLGMDLSNMRYEVNRNFNHLERNPQLIRCLFAPCSGVKGY